MALSWILMIDELNQMLCCSLPAGSYFLCLLTWEFGGWYLANQTKSNQEMVALTI
jgi:hypothetical protein